MTISRSTSDGPEWTLYDTDLTTFVRILHPLRAKLYLQQNEPGSGEVVLALTDPALAGIESGQLVVNYYRGAYRGAFLVEKLDWTYADNQEMAGLAIKISGPGPLAMLDDAIVWDWATPGYEKTRQFGTLDMVNLYGDGGAPLAKGAMLYHLLNEARDYSENLAHQPNERYCWRAGAVIDGAIMLDWDFDDTQDSDGNAWTDAEDIGFRVGMSLLDVLRQIAALEYDFTIERLTDGSFMLHAFASRLGSDRSSTVVFRVGQNVQNLTGSEAAGEIRNAMLIEYPGLLPYAEASDDISMARHRRRESLLQAADASTEDTATAYGTAEMAKTKDPKTDLSLKTADVLKPIVFVDYDLGDTIGYENGFEAKKSVRIDGLQLSWDVPDQKYANVSVEVE